MSTTWSAAWSAKGCEFKSHLGLVTFEGQCLNQRVKGQGNQKELNGGREQADRRQRRVSEVVRLTLLQGKTLKSLFSTHYTMTFFMTFFDILYYDLFHGIFRHTILWLLMTIFLTYFFHEFWWHIFWHEIFWHSTLWHFVWCKTFFKWKTETIRERN